jgi:excinuclease ABC subunit B
MQSPFKLAASFEPRGDQPAAIEQLTEGLLRGDLHQVLLGATGTGKTFTMANVIARTGLPTLVMAPNKILAAQLFSDLKEFFPEAAVQYFVSYYDYYQPEAFVPSTNTYIEKDAIINDEIDRMRHAATASLMSRQDVIIVASVSCIYGIGSRESYSGMLVTIDVGQQLDRDMLLERLVEIQYERNDFDFHRGTFRVRGDTVEIFPAAEQNTAIRVSFFGDEIDEIAEVDPSPQAITSPSKPTGSGPSVRYARS